MNENIQLSHLKILTPPDFSYEECLSHLKKAEQEVLYRIVDQSIYKLLKIDNDLLLIVIDSEANNLRVKFPHTQPTTEQKARVSLYVTEWFDLNKDLTSFYKLAENDVILGSVVQEFFGLRIIGIPNLFEALTWAILGQQINLTFAYTLKKRFVEQYGESVYFEGNKYYTFPSLDVTASLTVEELKPLQFSTRKAEYIIGVAQLMLKGTLTKEALVKLESFEQRHSHLTFIRGIGPWTADYVLMKSLQEPTAFPISDVGLHNALKKQLNLNRKPTLAELKELSEKWNGWQAYATFYLWRSL